MPQYLAVSTSDPWAVGSTFSQQLLTLLVGPGAAFQLVPVTHHSFLPSLSLFLPENRALAAPKYDCWERHRSW
jgi:hypothetical protein